MLRRTFADRQGWRLAAASGASWLLCGLGLWLVLLPWACSVQLPSPFVSGTPFIAKGTAETRSAFGGPPCPVWVDTTGILYHLFQTNTVTNEDFDRITTPGVTSRLRIAVRTDLRVGCEASAAVVEVEAVLEIIP